MLPLSLLRGTQNEHILVELKNGQTYNGYLVNCDSWMNINLKNVVCTSKEGDRFWNIPECYIRGNTIKYICIPNEVLSRVQEEEAENPPQNTNEKGGKGERGGRGGRGGGRGGRGGGRGGRGGNNNNNNNNSRGGSGGGGRGGRGSSRIKF